MTHDRLINFYANSDISYCALILSETLALYKSFTYLLTYLKMCFYLLFNFLSCLSKQLSPKIQEMLTRCMKAYSSSYSPTVSLSPAISSQFILGVCAAAEDLKNQ